MAQSPTSSAISQEQAYQIGIEAYHYLYPLILMDITRRVMTNADGNPSGDPINQFSHRRSFPAADFRAVVRPNFDTLYSSAWIDLSKGPLILSAPNTEGRYYLLPLLDMWSDVFASPGKRTSGTGAGSWAVVPPGWRGELPASLERIDSPTPYVWLIGRTQTNGKQDYEAVHKIQDLYTIAPLPGGTPAPLEPVNYPAINLQTEPLRQINAMSAAAYFGYGAELMKIHPPHITDWSILSRFKRIGIEVGKSFDLATASPEIRSGLERATAEGLKLMMAKSADIAKVVNGWAMNTDSMGVYGNFYLKRAVIALIGLGANQPEDAIYPFAKSDADGQPLKGEHKYVLHFDKDELPPVEAFWSITMYDAEGYQVANPLDRFAIGDRDNLKYNPDGSLDIYIQHESPGADKESNWLPSPGEGILGVTMRLYAPRAEILDGTWQPPAVKCVS